MERLRGTFTCDVMPDQMTSSRGPFPLRPLLDPGTSGFEGTMGPDCKEIVVVDDDSDIRDALTTVLEEAGYHVTAAADGCEALDVLHHVRRPCVMVLDMVMPRMTGPEVLQHMHDDGSADGIPVVAVSANVARKPDGAQAFLPKPFAIDELLTTVKRLCKVAH